MPIVKKKDEKAMDHQYEEVVAELSRPDQMTPEYIQSLGRSVYSIIDPEVVSLLADEDLNFLIPALSHLNRMTQINKQDVVLDRLDIEYIFLRLRATMKEKDYSVEKASLIDSLQYFANHIPTDAFDGFKAKLLAYQMKIIRTELEEKKTKGLIG